MNKPIERIEFKVTGPNGRGAARLDDFIRLAESLRSSLHEVARCLAPDLGRMEFEIVDLKFSSAFASIRPVIAIPDILAANDVMIVHRQTMHRLQAGDGVDRRLDFLALESFRPFIAPLKGRHQPKVQVDGVSLSIEFESNLMRMIEPDTTELGELTGQMDAVNLHGSNRFVLYAVHDASRVICYFPESLFDKVKDGLGKRVTIHGLLSFKRGIPMPRRADVERIEVFEKLDAHTSLLDLRGKLKGKIKQPSKVLIRALREEWDEA